MKRFTTLLCFLFIISISKAQDVTAIFAQAEKDMQDTVKYPYGHNAAAGKYYNIRGFNMYCEVYGQGEPLLIIHGNGGSINNFIYQIPYFKEHYKVIIADSRNQGKSADSGDSLTYEMMADDYAELLTQLHVDSANVIGWSDGGIDGLLLAMRHPEKVKKLAVTGANLAADSNAVPESIWKLVRPSYVMMKLKKNKTEQENTGYKLLRLLMEQPNIAPSSLQLVKCPTLVIGGDHDVIKEEHTMLIYKNIPRAYLWILPGSGHSTPIIFADDFNRTVDRFFRNAYKSFSPEQRFN